MGEAGGVITAERLHDAADLVAMLESYPEEAQIEEFIGGSDFPNYGQMDPASLAFGICVGIVAMQLDRDRLLRAAAAALERTQVDDSGEATMILEQVVTLSGEYVQPKNRSNGVG
jgi:hypothetical protein